MKQLLITLVAVVLSITAMSSYAVKCTKTCEDITQKMITPSYTCEAYSGNEDNCKFNNPNNCCNYNNCSCPTPTSYDWLCASGQADPDDVSNCCTGPEDEPCVNPGREGDSCATKECPCLECVDI